MPIMLTFFVAWSLLVCPTPHGGLVATSTQTNPASQLAATVDRVGWKSLKINIRLQQQSFAQTLKAFTAATGVSCFADGEPTLKSADLDVQGDAASVLSKVADIFDYNWKEIANKTISLTKRLSSPSERPQIIPEEMSATADDIARLLGSQPIENRSISSLFGAIYNSMRSAQVSRLRHGESVRVSELSPVQQGLVASAIYTHMLQAPIADWSRFGNRLKKIERSGLCIEQISVLLDLDGRNTEKQWSLTFIPSDTGVNIGNHSLLTLPVDALNVSPERHER